MIEGGDVGTAPSEGDMEERKPPSEGGIIGNRSPSDGGGTEGSVACDGDSKVRPLRDCHLDEVS